VISTGVTHSVRRLLEFAFGHVGLDYRDHVEIDSEADTTGGSGSSAWRLQQGTGKTRLETGKWNFEQLMGMMVDSDLELIANRTPKAASSAIY